MRQRSPVRALAAAALCGALGWCLASVAPVLGQSATYRAPRSPYGDGHPDINGIWQAVNTAYWDVEDHVAGPGYSNGPGWMVGAVLAEPPGVGIVEGGKIPYKPEALKKRDDNIQHRYVADVYKLDQGDAEIKCYLPGVPRAMYLPHPFRLTQTNKYINVAFSYASANRIIYLNNPTDAPVDSWMGWSNGHWEGDTLVVVVNGFNGYSWFDRAGNFMTDQTKITERYTRIGPDHMRYQVTVEDPQIYTRPWKMSMTLYRIVDPGAEIIEFKCIPAAEQALYGRYTKNWKPPVFDLQSQMPASK